jgi:hypothetical protein
VSAVSAPYQQGQAPWPDNQPQRPDRPPPIQFHSEGQAPRSNQGLAWTMRILGLIAVAVLSGLVWWYIQSDNGDGGAAGDGGANGQQQSGGAYDFTAKLDSPKVDNDCGAHAYGKTEQFFAEHPCQQLTRSAFTAKVGGRTVYTSVSVVAFDNAQDAADLQKLTQADNTGNVNDLVREGVLEVDGLKTLSADGGYASEVQGNKITIVESDYDPQSGDGGSEDELDDVSSDALRLGADITANGG